MWWSQRTPAKATRTWTWTYASSWRTTSFDLFAGGDECGDAPASHLWGQRLADPGLGPAGITVSGRIRKHRLARCRHGLADPALDHLPVGAVGARGGFPDPAHFSHACKAAYGMSPRTVRAVRH
ncbi:helix-turn-helix domain-containing protein [Streptomyces sp. NPDC058464]|uniref:helix-turn-helix domain-containing protein n=1 Tax=Streptomyces sp. NPDC058464 TaxID=3346511 RepID=UPI00365B57A8